MPVDNNMPHGNHFASNGPHPVDNNMPHGNHFASNGPHPGSAGSSANGNRRMPAPDTTEAFMMASRSGRTAKPAPAQPVANPDARTSMGGRSSYRQQSNTYQQQSRAYAAGRAADPSYGAAQAGPARNAYPIGSKATRTSSRVARTQRAEPPTPRTAQRKPAQPETRTPPVATLSPRRVRARLSPWLWASSSSPSWRLEAPRASSFIRPRRIFRRRQARSCLRSRP